MTYSITAYTSSVTNSSSQPAATPEEILTPIFDPLPLESTSNIFFLAIANPDNDAFEINRRALPALSLTSKFCYKILVPISLGLSFSRFIRMNPVPPEISQVVSILKRTAEVSQQNTPTPMPHDPSENMSSLNPLALHRFFLKELKDYGFSIPKGSAVVTENQFAELQKRLQMHLDQGLIKIWERSRYFFQYRPVFTPETSDALKATRIRICLIHVNNRQALDKTIQLDLKNLSLAILPPQIGLFRNLQKINLFHNQLQILPYGIGNLSKLEELNLSNNKLQTVPESIGNLSKLVKLNLSNNKLQTVPESIGNLSKLVKLNLSNNKLQTVPSSIGNLSKLEELMLDGNQLETVPDSIGNLNELKGLVLSNNKLQTVPSSIGNLSKLEGLMLDGNQLQTVPDSIGNLSELKGLTFSNNQLQTLPDSIGKLNELENLVLSNNQLQTLPDSIGNLSKLEGLALHNNQLQTFPDSIGNLSRLKSLVLSNNQLQTLPDSMGNLSELIQLFVDLNQLQILPNLIENLSKLQLYISPYNSIGETENLSDYQPLHHLRALRFSALRAVIKDEELNYPSQSVFAKFFQCLIQQVDLNEVKSLFEQLDSNFKNSVYEKIYELSTDPQKNKDLLYCKNHCFDNMDLFDRSVQEILLGFDGQSPAQKNTVYGYVYQLAGSPQTTDAKWGENHAFDNIPRLIDAIAKLKS